MLSIEQEQVKEEYLLNLIQKLHEAKDSIAFNGIQLVNLISLLYPNERSNFTNLDAFSNCYPCSGCSTNFNYENSLHLHLERRTCLIKLKCLKCNTIKKFFNKCKLLYHIYSHRSDSCEQIYTEIEFDILPIEKLNSTKENPFLNAFKSNQIHMNYASIQDLLSIEEFLHGLTKNNHQAYKCYICEALFLTLHDLKKHYQYDTRLNTQLDSMEKNVSTHNDQIDLDLSRKFDARQLQFLTKCNFLASLHLLKLNFNLFIDSNDHIHSDLVCPVCGLALVKDSSSGKITYFRQHLISECNYSIKYNKIKCFNKDCDAIYVTHRDGYKHWSDNHVREQKVCCLCDNELLNEEGDECEVDDIEESHFKMFHMNEPRDRFKIKTIWHCDCGAPSCAFDSFKLCRKHYTQKIQITSDYVCCFVCDKQIHFDRYKQHFLHAHKMTHIVLCFKCGYDRDDAKTHEEHLEKKHDGQCDNRVKISSNDTLYQCFNCKSIYSPSCNFIHNCMEPNGDESKSFNPKLTCFSPIYIKFNANIDDLVKYKDTHQFEEYKIDDQEDDDSVMDIELKENECVVCHKVFDDVLDLNLHIRSHGMYYLKINKKFIEKCS